MLPPVALRAAAAGRQLPAGSCPPWLTAAGASAFTAPCRAGDPRLMESALLIFASLARYVMPVLTQYLGTLNGLLQVRCGGGALRFLCGCSAVILVLGLHGAMPQLLLLPQANRAACWDARQPTAASAAAAAAPPRSRAWATARATCGWRP